ncbi:MAG: hypothetical protein L6R35_000004 [Caloplaca aegaea]|nr:MAG: hypothetical protein L6R35_000004 [Caloplaca aegaea]
MEHSYRLQSPINRPASQSMALAPPASMIDPSFEPNRLHSSQLPHGFTFPQSQPLPATMNGHGNLSSTHDSPDRALPSTEMSDDSIDQAYVDFILYCNPGVPADTDPTELKKGFRAPPMSDGKKFNPFTLYGLIARLENKEIKTWAQLVIELGVELPDPSKNQSAQKVQQYAVRLKRWLHAYHIDAFFHYCLRIPNGYYTDRPSKDQPLGETARDGVPPEEDLALRALLPELRPKRGRRKAEDGDEENIPAKKVQHQRSTSAEFFHAYNDQYSAHPSNSTPWSSQPQAPDAWAAAHMAVAPKTPSTGRTPSTAQPSAQDTGLHLRWRVNDGDNTPLTPYPQSAVTPGHDYSASPSYEEPKSANPAGLKSRSRKRHGPAVSSAWSNAATSAGKLRGRPPSNRSVADGPFSTFPANPAIKNSPQGNMGTPTQKLSSPPNHIQQVTTGTSGIQPTIMVTPQSATAEQALARRPSKLQLQVPEHAGGPVRLATPPTVLINGETGRQDSFTHGRRSSADFFNEIDEGSGLDELEEQEGSMGQVDWKRRALALRKKLREKEEELKAMKRRVLEAVM